MYKFVFHLKVLSHLIEIFPLKELCAQWDELLDYFMQSFPIDCQNSQKFEISDDYLLTELFQTLVRVCDTFPFLKSKTSGFIEQAFASNMADDKQADRDVYLRLLQ